MNNVTNWCLAMAIAVGLASDAFAQSNTIQLRNGANTTLLKSASSGGAVTLTMPAASGTLLSGSGTTDKVVRWSASGLTDGTFSDNGTGTLSTTQSTLLTTSNSTIGIKSTGSSNGNHTYLYISNPPAVWGYFNTATIESSNNNSVGFILNANGARGMIGLETWSGGGNYLQSQDNGDLGEMQFWIPDGLGTSGTSSGGSGSPIVAFYTGKAQSGLRVGNFVLGGSSTASQLRFMEPSGSGTNYTAFKAQAQAANVTYTLPSADGTNGQVLSTNGSGTLAWSTATAVGALDDLTDAKSGGTGFTNSIIVGHQTTGTLSAGDPASLNAAFGIDALKAITDGDNNIAMGYRALPVLTSGSQNIAIGTDAGYDVTTATYNVLIGFQTGYAITTGSENVAIGYGALSNTSQTSVRPGSRNVAIGDRAMFKGGAGNDNVAVGSYSQHLNGDGAANVTVGSKTGEVFTTANNNTFIGHHAGKVVTTGSGNVLIGYRVGSTLTTQDNQLYIDNSATTTPLIQGDFTSDALTFNGSTTTTGSVTVAGKSIATAYSGAAKTANTVSPGTAIAAFSGTYEKIAITATTGAGFVQLPAGTEGQVVYLHMTFTANGSNTVTVVNSDGTNTAMVYDGTNSDEIVAHMLYTTTKGWVVFSALEYDN